MSFKLSLNWIQKVETETMVEPSKGSCAPRSSSIKRKGYQAWRSEDGKLKERSRRKVNLEKDGSMLHLNSNFTQIVTF